MSETINLTISGMTCKHCVMNASKALEAVTGVENVEVTLEPGGAVVSGDMDKESLIAAISTAGYEAK